MPIFYDHLDRKVTIAKNPQRIISLVPCITETLSDLNLEKRIVGITKYCIHPYHYQSTRTIVGGTKEVDLDIIKQLNPDIIFCNKEENTPKIIEDLEQITPVFVSHINSFDKALNFIEELGIILGKRTDSDLIVNKIKQRHQAFTTSIEHKRGLKTSYFIWKDPWMVAGKETFINEMLQLNRFENVFIDKQEHYPKVNINHLNLQGNPELLLFSSEPYPFKEDDIYEVLRQNSKVLSVFVDGTYFSWYGSRLLESFSYFESLQQKIAQYE